MVTSRKINIPIFDYKVTIYVVDDLMEVKNRLPRQDVSLENTKAITFSNSDIGGCVVAIKYSSQSSVVHEAIHIKNAVWNYIGYSPQADNDEVDAYLVTYIYDKIMEVFRRHKDTC